jgi:hypothetical protein
MTLFRQIVDRKGLVHAVATWPNERTHGLTRCGHPFTHNQAYAKPWPSSEIVDQMRIVESAPNCVHCAVS